MRGQSNSGESIDGNMESNLVSFSPNRADQNISLSHSSDQPSPCLSLHCQSDILGARNQYELPSSLETGQKQSLVESSCDTVLGSTGNMISEDDTSDQGPKLIADDVYGVAEPKLSGGSSDNVDHSVGVIGKQDDIRLVESSCDAVLGSTENIISKEDTFDQGPKLFADDDNDVTEPKLSGVSSDNVDHSVGVIGTPGQQDDMSPHSSLSTLSPSDKRREVQAASSRAPRHAGNNLSNNITIGLNASSSHAVPISPGSLYHVFLQHPSLRTGVGIHFSSYSHPHPHLSIGVHPERPQGNFNTGIDLRSQQNPVLFNSFGTGNFSLHFGFSSCRLLLRMQVYGVNSGSSTQNMVFVPCVSALINSNFWVGLSMERRHLSDQQGFSHYPQHHSLAIGSYGTLVTASNHHMEYGTLVTASNHHMEYGTLVTASNHHMEYNLGYQQWPFLPWDLPSTSRPGGRQQESGYAPWFFSPWNVYGPGSGAWIGDFAGPYSATYGHLTFTGHNNLGIYPFSLGTSASFSPYGHHLGRLAMPHASQFMGAGVESVHRTVYELHPLIVDTLIVANLPTQPLNLAPYFRSNTLGFPEGTLVLDRYNDMRLDVDAMSYEELLSLGNRIGSVRTGLSEETIMVLLRRKSSECAVSDPSSDAEACVICREEYAPGEDIGVLNCSHEFHTECIKQWLVVKNNCPICKLKGVGA